MVSKDRMQNSQYKSDFSSYEITFYSPIYKLGEMLLLFLFYKYIVIDPFYQWKETVNKSLKN